MNPTQNTPGTTSDDEPVSGLLRAAADYIDTYGWTQDQLHDIDGTDTPPACALGAIDSVIRWRRGPDPAPIADAIRCNLLHEYAVHTLGHHLSEADGTYATGDELRMVIERWNDQPHRVKPEVTATLRDAADLWDLTHGPAHPAQARTGGEFR